MELTPTARRLVERAAAQIVRELSRTPVAKIPLGEFQSGPWVGVDPQLGPEGGLKYIKVALGRFDYRGGVVEPLPGLIEAVARGQLDEAHWLVEQLIVRHLRYRLDTAV